MIRSFRILSSLVVLGLATSGALAQEFSLGFTGVPDSIAGNPGSVQSLTIAGTLSSSAIEGADGAQGWSISVSMEGGSIVAATTRGTVAQSSPDVDEDCIPDPGSEPGLRVNGFHKTELTEGENNAGVVSAVVLSFTCPITLEPNTTHEIIFLDIETTIPAGGGSARIFYVDDLQGSGQPVPNRVTFAGKTFVPSMGEQTIGLDEVIDCDADDVELDLEWLGSPSAPFEVARGEADVIDQLTVPSAPGEVGTATVFVAIDSNLPDGRTVQGWSLSIAFDGASPDSPTTRGTVGATVPDVDEDCIPDEVGVGLRVNGFQKTEAVDPTVPVKKGGPAQGAGVVSAIVLSFTCPITLAPQGVATVLVLNVVSNDPVPDEGSISATLSFRDGLRGSGQPVPNAVTVAGGTEAFCALGQQSLPIIFEPVQVAAAIRSDGNADGRTDIADAIYLINNLFRDGPPFACEPAADANDDGMVDLGDATFVIGFLFMGGPAPDLTCQILEGATSDNCSGDLQACVTGSG